MAATPYMTSNDLVEAVKRKISLPSAQQAFSQLDILSFLNEETMVSQVPSVLQYHQEYYVYTILVPLLSNQNRYPIPDRAIGMRLRNLFWIDQNGNYFELSRIQEEDKAFYARNIGANTAIHKYYPEGNDIVLTPQVISSPTGQLAFEIFIRPNQLVTNDRAITVTAYSKTLTVDNSTIHVGDYLTITTMTTSGIVTTNVLTAVSGITGPNQFVIGATSANTAANLATAITATGTVTSAVAASAIITIVYSTLTTTFATLSSINQPAPGLLVQAGQGVMFNAVPSTWQNPVTLVTEPLFTNNILVDFLQTKAGHKIRSFDVLIPANGITGTTINFSAGTVPQDLIVGDYVCLANECIIPYLPPDLHSGLAERAAARILAALGDQIGLGMSQQKIADLDARQGNLLDNRVDGSPLKVSGRKGLLRYGKLTSGRRY
jgi:hypothetical protein